MITPMTAPLVLRRNDNPCRVTFVVENEDGSVKDMSGLSAKLHIRQYPGAPGDPWLEALSTDVSGSRLIPSADGIEAIFTKLEIDAMPVSGKAGEPVFPCYDLLVTEAGDENAWFEGPVTVNRGVVP